MSKYFSALFSREEQPTAIIASTHEATPDTTDKPVTPSSHDWYPLRLAEHPRVYGLLLLAVWVLLLVYGIQAFGGLQDGGFTPPASESQVTLRYFSQRFVSPNEDVNILVSHPTWTVDDPRFKQAYQTFKTTIESTLPVYALLSYFDYPETVSNLSADRKHAKVTARTRNDASITLKQYRATTVGNPLSFEFAGASLANLAVNEALAGDLVQIEGGALPVLVVVLVLVFEGVVAALFPIALALWTLACVLASLRAISLGFNVSNFTINATTIFGVGLAIDFSLFLHYRFKNEFARNGRSVVGAVSVALSTSGRAVIFSACTLSACLAGALQFNMFYLSTMALAVILSAIHAAIGTLTLLPVMYILLGEKTFSLNTDRLYAFLAASASSSYHFLTAKLTSSDASLKAVALEESVAAEHAELTPDQRIRNGHWYRVVAFVMRYPLVFLVCMLGCLSGLMYVFIDRVRFGSGGLSLLPLDSEILASFEEFQKYIPSTNGAVLDIYMQTKLAQGTRNADFLTALHSYSGQVRSLPNVIGVRNMVKFNSSVSLATYITTYADPYAAANVNFTKQLLNPFFITDFSTVSRTAVYFNIEPNDENMRSAIRKIRRLTSGSNVTVFLEAYGVTGAAAVEFDVQQDLIKTIPNFIAVVVSSMFLFVTLLTGSLVAPLKAIITAGLSIISSYAFLVLIFQEGPQNAQDLLHFRPNGYLDPLNLIFIFAVAFGLSLDYEIFMLSRITEVWQNTRDHPHAVASGIEQTARAVTLAALLLCIVLGAFLASRIKPLKEIGMVMQHFCFSMKFCVTLYLCRVWA